MANPFTRYVTKGGEMLDEICWRHYREQSSMMEAIDGDPRLAGAGAAVREGAMSLSQFAPYPMRGIVEAVLEANPGLAARGFVLPPGIEITLPVLDDQLEDTDVVRLWDD